jgi:hypothetical protein
MSPEARSMCGLMSILVPTIVYGGLTVLGIITVSTMGAPAPEIWRRSRRRFIEQDTRRCLVHPLAISADRTRLRSSFNGMAVATAERGACRCAAGFRRVFRRGAHTGLRFILYLGAILFGGNHIDNWSRSLAHALTCLQTRQCRFPAKAAFVEGCRWTSSTGVVPIMRRMVLVSWAASAKPDRCAASVTFAPFIISPHAICNRSQSANGV